MSRTPLRTFFAVSVAATALLVSGCAGTSAPADTPAPTAADGAISDDALVTPGKLTIATGDIAYFPYVIDDKPESGEGFESAVAYAVAAELGFEKDDVVWVRTSFEAAIAPGPKNFDINIQQYTITDERKNAVDFSSPYYSASQAIVAIKGNKAEEVTDLAGTKDLLLGAMTGSTSAKTIEVAVSPTQTPRLYGTNEDARAALESNQFDGFVLDLPTAVSAVNGYIANSFIVGQLPAAGIEDDWGLLLAKDSELTPAVTAAVDTLREDGTLDALADEWLGVEDVPVLQ